MTSGSTVLLCDVEGTTQACLEGKFVMSWLASAARFPGRMVQVLRSDLQLDCVGTLEASSFQLWVYEPWTSVGKVNDAQKFVLKRSRFLFVNTEIAEASRSLSNLV